mmetsp:Transcript_787/g.2206  ORF Transcript_787/g.2206 Transcript_787/m.2206 type:complete len:236 (-) Transcript_787:165-872(-)
MPVKNPAEDMSSLPCIRFQARARRSISRSVSGYSSFSTRYLALKRRKAAAISDLWTLAPRPPGISLRSANSANSRCSIESRSSSALVASFSPLAMRPSSSDAPEMRDTPANWRQISLSPSARRRIDLSATTPRARNMRPMRAKNPAGREANKPSFLSFSHCSFFSSYTTLATGVTRGLERDPANNQRAPAQAKLPRKSLGSRIANGLDVRSSRLFFAAAFCEAMRSLRTAAKSRP